MNVDRTTWELGVDRKVSLSYDGGDPEDSVPFGITTQGSDSAVYFTADEFEAIAGHMLRFVKEHRS